MIPAYYLNLFYPPEVRRQLEALFSRVEYIDPETMSEEESYRRRRELNPEVIVVGWETYSLRPDEPVGPGGLQYVCNTCGGVRNLVPRCLIEQGLIVTDWGKAISHTVAEGAMTLILASLRRITESVVRLRAGDGWHTIKGRSLFRKRVGLHGFGRVAQCLVRLLNPFQVDISVFAAGMPDAILAEFGVERVDSLEALFDTC